MMPFDPTNRLIDMAGWENTTVLTNRAVQPFEEGEDLFGNYTIDNVVGLGRVHIKEWEVAMITLDFTDLFRNFTYGAHFRLALYADCTPCMIRIVCNENPDLECCSCKQYGLPYFFTDTSYKSPSNYPDNKHIVVQISVAAMAPVAVYIVFELVDGLYYGRFYDISPRIGNLHIYRPRRAWSDEEDNPANE